jgi:hypothetical protein
MIMGKPQRLISSFEIEDGAGIHQKFSMMADSIRNRLGVFGSWVSIR